MNPVPLDDRFVNVLIFWDCDMNDGYVLYYSPTSNPHCDLKKHLDAMDDNSALEEASRFLDCSVDELPMIARG